MRVLVIGGAGFIGSHTVDALLARGHEVRVLDSLETRVHGERTAPDRADVEFIHGNAEDEAALTRALERVDAVFHLAAYQDYMPDFSHFFRVNTTSTALLYEVLATGRLSVSRVVVASSQAVYGEGTHRCTQHGVFSARQRAAVALADGQWDILCPTCRSRTTPAWSEESHSMPVSAYGISKLAQENIAITLGAQLGIATVALRYSIVQGPRQSFRNAYSGALRSFAVRVLNDRVPIMFEDGNQLRDYVSVHDVVNANLLALESPNAVGRVLNVGSSRAVSVRELASIVVSMSGRALDPEAPGLYRVGDVRHVLSDTAALRSLGWSASVSQHEMVREYLTWAALAPNLKDFYEEAEARMRAARVLKSIARDR